MSHHANEVFYENLREKILDTNFTDLLWEIDDHATTTSDGCPDASIALVQLVKSNEDLFIEFFEFCEFPENHYGRIY